MRLLFLLPALLLLNGCTSEAPDTPPEMTAADTTTSTTPPDTLAPDQYVGVEYPPVPGELDKRGGALIVPPDTPASEAQYAFVEVRRGDRNMLWLGHLQHRTPEGEAIFRVVDAVAVPDVADDERFLINGCTADGRVGYAAVVADEDAEQLTQVRHAWRADRETGQLVPTDDAPITCENVSFGL